jgi:hypothetical protein
MTTITGLVNINFINDDNTLGGTQLGLIMSYLYQTVVFTPFMINKTHFTHYKRAWFVIKDLYVEMTESRYAYPFYVRIWNIASNGINPSSDFTINFPNQKHEIYDNETSKKIDKFTNLEYNGWHISLPPIYMHSINGIIPLGSVIHYKNKITGLAVNYAKDVTIFLSMYFLKQLINGIDINYSALYYGINSKMIVVEDWYIYTNLLKTGDVIQKIEGIPAGHRMYMDKIKSEIYMDTWITWMFFDKPELEFTIKRNGAIHNIKIPRIPMNITMQIKYYSENNAEITLEKININHDEFRYAAIGSELKDNPKKLFV